MAEEGTQPAVGFAGAWDRSAPLIDQASREIGVSSAYYKVADLLTPPAQGQDPLASLKILYVLNIDPTEAIRLKDRVAEALKVNPGLKVIPLDHRDSQAALEKAGFLLHDEAIPKYWRANGLVNIRRLLRYTSVTYLGGKGEIEPAAMVPDYGYYCPGVEDALPTLAEYKAKAGWTEGAPVVVLIIQQSFWVTHDTKVIDAEVQALRKEGFNAITIFGDRGLEVGKMLQEAKPDLIVEDRHGTMWEEGQRNLLEELDVPYLRPISMLAYTMEEWMKDPRGLAFRDVGMFMTLQESKGTIEPVVVGALQTSIQGFHLHVPIPDRIERFAKRAASWMRLRKKHNAEKKVAIIYYNKSLGKDDFMRGSPTGAFLDGPESLVRFLPRLKEKGYMVDPLPKTAAEVISWIRDRGRNIGPWAQGELDAMADKPDSVLVPAEQYEAWFQTRLTEAQRAEMIRLFGPPPGKLMVVTRNDRKFIVIPTIRLGNVLLTPQPERGEKQDEKLLHSRDVPPPHHYLAFYWWLQEVYGADAILHWGTHGSLELLPGKEAGLTGQDWGDLCAGGMPIINPWIMDNLGEATLSRRRSYAVLVDHQVPPSVASGLSNDLQTLHGDIEKFQTLEPGVLKEEFRKRITQGVLSVHLDETLKFEGLPKRALTEEEVSAAHSYLHMLTESTTPTTLHVLGVSPDNGRLPSYLVTILRKPFLERLAGVYPPPSEGEGTVWLRVRAEEFVKETALEGKEPPAALAKDVAFARDVLQHLNRADDEITGILKALDGRFVPPGPGPEPVRNPSSIPSGRNLYALNPEEIPTKASWEVGIRLIDEMLKTKHPKKIGFDLSGMETMRDFGVLEAQVLYAMGIRPVWDQNNLAVDVEVIPRGELKHPRIDVFLAMGGLYKENFGSRVRLLDKAVRLASELREDDNGVRAGTEVLRQQLLSKGFASGRAKALATARIFGTKPGNMSGTNILYLAPRSGVWEKDDEITSVYTDSMSYAYTGELWGEKVDGLYESAIQGTDTLVRVWASNMTSQLSNHHAYEYLGGLSMAVKKLTGREPEALIADVRDPDGARMRDFEEVLATNLRTELLSRKWIEGMKEHGYAGAGHIAELTKNTFGWDVTRSGCISDATWKDIYEVYVKDRYKLGMQEWFDKENPHALQEMAATLLEASRKGYWHADVETLATLSKLYAQSVVKHGPSAGLISGGNAKLDAFAALQLNAPGDAAGATLASQLAAAVSASSGGSAPADKVLGQKMEKVEKDPARDVRKPAPVQPLRGMPIAAVAVGVLGLLVLYGFLTRRGI